MADSPRPGGRKQRRTRGPIGSGIDPATGEWHPAVAGQRPPFGRGNDLQLRHGGYATLRMQPRAAEIAAELQQLVPNFAPGDAVVLGLLGMALARLERVTAILDEIPEGVREPKGADRLRHEQRQQSRIARDLCSDLGLTPRSRAALARDVAGVRHTDALRDHLSANYPQVVDAG